mgnify:CR=1 FL=1
MSRFDPRDPGQDPAYCDGLAVHEDEDGGARRLDHAQHAFLQVLTDLRAISQQLRGEAHIRFWEQLMILEAKMLELTTAVAAQINREQEGP